jgi:hypothetical protein
VNIVATSGAVALALADEHNAEVDHTPSLAEIIRTTRDAHDLTDSGFGCVCGDVRPFGRQTFAGHLSDAIAAAVEAAGFRR